MRPAHVQAMNAALIPLIDTETMWPNILKVIGRNIGMRDERRETTTTSSTPNPGSESPQAGRNRQ